LYISIVALWLARPCFDGVKTEAAGQGATMSTAAVFLDIEKAFDITWHPGLLYKLSELEFPTSFIKLISLFLSQRKFRVSVEGEMSTPREMQARVPQGSVLSPLASSFNCLFL
jgi:hypothetical protein